jgi:hypothetical protein
MFINLSPVPGVISIPEAVPVFARPFRRKRKFFGDEEFNIETAAYTPPPGETVEAPSWVKEWVAQYEPSQTTWPSETRFVTSYQPPSVTPTSSVSIKQPTEEGWLPVLKSLISGATVVGSKYLETRAQEKRIKPVCLLFRLLSFLNSKEYCQVWEYRPIRPYFLGLECLGLH